MMAHCMWSKLGSSEYDYNFTFLTPSTAALYNMMSKEERTILKVPSTPDCHQLLATTFIPSLSFTVATIYCNNQNQRAL